MKKWIAITFCFLLGSIATAWASFAPFAQGPTWNANALYLYSVFSLNNEEPNFAITGTQLLTGNALPSFATSPLYAEPVTDGRAFEFVVHGLGGGSGWTIEQNSIFVIENGVGGPEVQVDIYGNVGPLVHNFNNNRLLLASFYNFTPVDGDLGYNVVDSQGWIELSGIIYSYSVDGTNGGGSTFDFTATDGTNTATATLPCQHPFGTTGAVEDGWAGTTTFNNFASLTFSISNTANCAVVPDVRSLQVKHVFTNAP